MKKTFKDFQDKELNLKTRKKTTVFRHENIHPENYDFEDLPNYLSKYKSEPLLVELFCGAGGLSIGLMEEGFRPALSVDNNSNGDYKDFGDVPPDEDGTENNGEPNCGEPNVDDYNEILPSIHNSS